MSTGGRADRTVTAQEVLDAGEVVYDLRTPPTRDEVGMAEGRSTLGIQHDGGRPLVDVTVVLDDDVRLEVAASLITFNSIRAGADGDPTTLELVTTYPSVEAAHAHLVDLVDRFDGDLGAVEQWRTEAERLVGAAGAGGEPTYATTVFALGQVGAVELEVEAATFATRGEVGVRHVLTWEPAGS
ncbi:hypothetical protein [Actinomarinicola tropica]|uniref:Uncharacterized protein n=1 Tax=Actinomarinicola tropica TaxID=2789776 RepID=A0A5Q2RQC7_9ACTN|nr:hypothetical protein [Actinomarinicola tropica]QGG96646.1 hypothetical protein GH723_16940 [Actinomarinicola tropica]